MRHPWNRSTLTKYVGAFLVAVTSAAPSSLAGQDDALGVVVFPTSCGPAVAQRIDRAVALLHHMTYPEAQREFEAVAKASPRCAIAQWGVAMTLFQPLWPTRPTREDMERGWMAVQAAKRMGAPTARERGYVAMAEAFFAPGPEDYWGRIARWEKAAATLHRQFPEDLDAATFYALAHLATAPAGGGTQHNAEAAALLDSVLRVQPMHPGAIHYTIHANDAPGREHESLDVVRRYLEIAPRNPHALHMPTHIFVRLGEWDDVIRWNREAVEAALRQPAGENGQWVWDEYPHASEYLVYALLQKGDDSAASDAIRRLRSTASLQPSFKTAFHLSSMPARYALERRAWAEATLLDPRPATGLAWERYPWPQAITWFARGLGAVHDGDLAAAHEAESRLAELRGAAEAAGEALFTRQIEILRLELEGWIAHGEGDDPRALELLRSAVTLERGTPKHAVTPAATLPAQELLGDLLSALGRPAEALPAYRASLESTPGRLNSLLGALRAASAAGDDAAAAGYRDRLRDQVVPDSPRRDVRAAIGAEPGA